MYSVLGTILSVGQFQAGNEMGECFFVKKVENGEGVFFL